MARWSLCALLVLWQGGLGERSATADTPTAAESSSSPTPFAKNITPFLTLYCNDCHGTQDPEAELALEPYRDSANIQQDFPIWQKVLRMLVEQEMPPADQSQPSATERIEVIAAIQAEMAKFDCGELAQPGRVTIRRLNRSEYNNTIRDLVGIDFKPASDFPSDDVGNGFDNIGDVLSIPPLLLEKYLAAAETVVQKAYQDDQARERILLHRRDERTSAEEAVRRNLHGFTSRAFRREATSEEIDRLLELHGLVRENGYSREEAFQATLQAVLTSPHFLFRVELDPQAGDESGIRELNDYELASRLSYFLWSSMPDEELLTLAGEKRLREPEVLQAQVSRMLGDPKADALVKDFAGQWLQLRDLASLTPDPQRFPDFDDELREAMLAETEMFFATMIREDRSVLDFLDADFTFVNQRLARHYGLAGIEGEDFRRVALPPQRRGVLTQGSILLLTSNPTRTSPVKRGKWILDNILGEPPPPPPPGVEELEDDADLLGSLRERMEQHRANESCAVCHRKMDALGFGLENFDAIGAWRDRDGAFEINASGALPGASDFNGPQELMAILKTQKKAEFCRCLAEKMLTYALGRGLESYDRCAVDKITEQLAAGDYRFSVLVRAIVTSDPFLLRESKGGE